MGLKKKNDLGTISWVNSHNTSVRKTWSFPFLVMNKVIPKEDKQVLERRFKLSILTSHYRLFLQYLLPSLLKVVCPSSQHFSFPILRQSIYTNIVTDTCLPWWVISTLLFWVFPNLSGKDCFWSAFSMLHILSSPTNLKELHKHIYSTESHAFLSSAMFLLSSSHFLFWHWRSHWTAHPYRHILF